MTQTNLSVFCLRAFWSIQAVRTLGKSENPVGVGACSNVEGITYPRLREGLFNLPRPHGPRGSDSPACPQLSSQTELATHSISLLKNCCKQIWIYYSWLGSNRTCHQKTFSLFSGKFKVTPTSEIKFVKSRWKNLGNWGRAASRPRTVQILLGSTFVVSDRSAGEVKLVPSISCSTMKLTREMWAFFWDQ